MTWQVGDLAVCIATADPLRGKTDRLQVGAIYTVTGVYASKKEAGCFGLILRETKPRKHPGFHSHLFRRVVRDKHEACESEFVDLLNRIKRKVQA